MPKQTQPKSETPLEKAADTLAAAGAKVKRLIDERGHAERALESVKGELQTAQMELDAALAALHKVALERS